MNTESTAYEAYTVHEIKQTGYGTYRIIVRDADGNPVIDSTGVQP